MADVPHPPPLLNPMYLHRGACRTALGDGRETIEAMLDNSSGLLLNPIYAEDGGDEGPLALRQPMSRCNPPRWWDDLVDFIQPLVDENWGTIRRPVFITSSNYGIDGLYGLGKERNQEYAEWSTPHGCMSKILEKTNWGSNITILSHACVSAQLGLYKAAQMLGNDLADEVLVLSFDYVGPFVASGFHSLKILNQLMPAPYENREVGSIGLGDGIGYAVLRKEGSGPRIEAQSLYNEMFHFTANAPEGIGFIKALDGLNETLRNRKCWIKGHGTGTLEAGRMEAETCARLFPESHLVSWKGALGHTLGSCALVELILTLESLKSGKVPGTVGTTGPCFSDNVAIESFEASVYDSVLLLSNAFGGAHGAMVLSHE